MESSPTTDYCVYTIAALKKLQRVVKEGGTGTFKEGKRWTGACGLLREARDNKQSMPILFADAGDCSRLLYRARLTKVEVLDNGTTYTFDHLASLPGKHTPQELRLRKTRNKIAPKFIRPYAICLTPTFVKPGSAF